MLNALDFTGIDREFVNFFNFEPNTEGKQNALTRAFYRLVGVSFMSTESRLDFMKKFDRSNDLSYIRSRVIDTCWPERSFIPIKVLSPDKKTDLARIFLSCASSSEVERPKAENLVTGMSSIGDKSTDQVLATFHLFIYLIQEVHQETSASPYTLVDPEAVLLVPI